MKLIFPLLGLGTTVGGVFIGSIQQNVLKTEKPYIDFLFEEIEKDIRDFSNRNPLTATVANEIKKGDSSSGSDSVSRKRRDVSNTEEKTPKNTLGVWTDIWIQLLSNYIKTLWIGNQKNINASTTLKEEVRHFSDQEKQKAIDAAEKAVKNEKRKFEEKLTNLKNKIEEIYQKMKKFLQIMKLPKKYNSSTDEHAPYEEYVMKILEE